MKRVADHVNNPFVFDRCVVPPSRSALAVLNVEREELASTSIDDLLARALTQLSDDPDLATCYGQPVSADDLREAADALRDPASRLVNMLLDYRHHRFDLAAVEEVQERLERFERKLVRRGRPRSVEIALVARLLQQILTSAEAPKPDDPQLDPPEIPSIDTLLTDLL